MRSRARAPSAGAAPPVADPAPAASLPARVLLAAISAFIVYGSLFPFDFSSHPLPLASFFAEHDLFARQSDAIDNFLLFVPLGVALHASFRPAGRIAGALLALLLLAVGLQLVQLYLPDRTASVSDAAWNTLGMLAGLLVADRVRRMLGGQLAGRDAGRDNFLPWLILIWFFYESFPFVPTLDIGLLRSHIKTVVLAPPFEPMRLLQHALAAALAGIAAARAGRLRRPALGVAWIGALALGLEVCVAYGSLRRETLLGIALGLGLGFAAARRLGRRAAALALVLALCAYLIAALTPYRGQDAGAGFTWTPFSHLLWNGALGELPPAAFEALAIGAMLWAGVGRFRPWAWSALVLALLAALEWVRVALLGYHGDTTALVMALVLAPAAAALRAAPVPGGDRAPQAHAHGGAYIGPHAHAAAGAYAEPRVHAAAAAAIEPHARARVEPARPSAAGMAPGWRAAALLPAAGAAAALTLAMWTLVHLPGIPYNLAKLFGAHALGGAAVFSLALLWLGGGAWLAAYAVLRLEARGRQGVPWLPLMLAAVALASFVLVDLATPAIMLNKIIGAPDLYRRIVEESYWGDAWRAALAPWPRALAEEAERALRYVALYSAFMIPLAAGLLGVPARGRRARLLLAIAWLAPFWVLVKYVVLDWAITDNLTELVSEHGAAWLAAVLALFGANASAVVAHAGRARSYPALAGLTLTLAGVAWWLFGQGIENVVINNGRVFGGVQFLLGENRSALLPQGALFGRWCALYAGATAVAACGALLARRALPAPAAPQPVRRRRAARPRA